MQTYYRKKKYGSRKGKNVFSRRGKKYSKKNGRRTRKTYHRGGSVGLDKLGYGWEGSNIATWPGVQGNADSITRANHLMVSPYGIPVGGVELPHSTSGDSTGSSYMGGEKKRRKYKSRKYRGGYYYDQKSPSRNTSKRSIKKSSHKKKKLNQRGGIFFQDVRNFGRYLANGVKTRINGVQGIKAPVGVMPTDQPYIDRNVDVIVSDPVDVEKIYLDNSNAIAKI